jgi:subtilisin-like proprotein convertase family protein/sugar lactone lactonase YvrE
MKNRNWFLVGLLLLGTAALVLRQGEQRRLRELTAPAGEREAARTRLWDRLTNKQPVLPASQPAASAFASAASPKASALGEDPKFPFRLRNTSKPDAELFRSETAVLLRNALVETLEPLRLNIPEHLRAKADPGSYVVQARGAVDDRFRAVLRGAGAEFVSYVPNNAYLVRASAAVAEQLKRAPHVQSVLPFEPFYKLDMQLLPFAVRQEPLPVGRWLNLVVFAGTQEKALSDLRAMGAVVKGQQRFPFGHVVTIAPPADSLVALAQMTAVQNIEAYQKPVLLNDLSRVRLGVSSDTTTLAPVGNWLNLTGLGATVGIVGSGLETTHPLLSGRTYLDGNSPASDLNGHETFMGAVIAGIDGPAPTATNGSISGASYRGMAPGAKLYPMSLFEGGFTNFAHEFLITNSSMASNIYIVNNSWGYPIPAYDIYSAIYDEAVRDSNPARTNDQPMTHVFAAGNLGGGNSGGLGGAPDSILSPATAKNVITVGALEQFRLIVATNDPLSVAHTDSDDQVLDTSSRGNVGVGLEGPSGRLKPDLVAPGAYVVSARAGTFTNVTDADNQLGSSQFRYESGSSVAAAKISGLLALMQQYFGANYTRTNKPALNKALLINRARTAGPAYDVAPNNLVSHQGWGLPSLSNTLPTAAAYGFPTNTAPNATARIVAIEESCYITNRLASGQYHAFNVTVQGSATSTTNTLRITLAWTDPPGNPVASTKLVNDLDLYVTNTVANGREFEGNNIAPGTTISQPTPQGSQSVRDSVNNVENAFITLTNTVATTFRVFVIGRKVNVNAVTAETNNVVQDYALVIGTDDTRTVQVAPAAPFFTYTNRPVQFVTNGLPYLNERVGSSSPLLRYNPANSVNTNGVTNQWNFYVFTNQNLPSTLTNFVTNIVAGVTNVSTNVVRPGLTNGGPYVSFATFLPPNLARARNQEADIDLYMTRSSAAYGPVTYTDLTNLDQRITSHANTMKSTNRGGFELISLSNSFIGEVFVVGIKAEDQQGGSYGFFAAASQTPFTNGGTNGGFSIQFLPVPIDIPDGTPEEPRGVMLFGIATTNMLIRTLAMSNVITHENLGDLVGVLTHNGRSITLNNHTISPAAAPVGGGPVTHNLLYDDFRNPPDGPGDMVDFLGEDAVGLWILEIYDNAPFQTGTVDYAQLYVTPYTNAVSTNTNVFFIQVTLQAGQSFVDLFNVPTAATNLDVDVVGGLPPGPVAPGQGVELYASSGGVPTGPGPGVASAVDLDSLDLSPHVRINPTTTPPLTAGPWSIRIVNNTSGQLLLTVRYTLGMDFSVSTANFYRTNALVPLLDNYTTNVFMSIPDNRIIAGVDVGMSILHPRIADLRVHLVAPSGTKALLLENRGGTNGILTSNFFGHFTENTAFTTSVDTNGTTPFGFFHYDYLMPVKFVPAPYSAVISPPRLVTNLFTNFLAGTATPISTNTNWFARFGYGSASGSSHESPGGIAILGQQLVMGGAVNRNGTNDAFFAAYRIPFTNNYSETNWAVSNFWTGPFSGYRGANKALPAPSQIPEQTRFNSVAISEVGVVAAVGQTRNWFPPVVNTWSGSNTTLVNDIDLGCTSGRFTYTFASDAIADRIVIQYEGLTLMDQTSATGYTTNFAFSGGSRFLRIVANPTPAAGGTWTSTLTVLRSNGVSYAVGDFLSGTIRPGTNPPVAPNTLSAPRGVALDSTGNVYVADSGNGRILRFGQALSIPFGGSFDSANGTYSPISTGTPVITGLSSPGGVAVSPTNGDIYVADTGNHQIKRYSSNGTLLATWGVAGSPGSANSGAPGFPDGQLNQPQGLVVHTNGVVYVADTGNSLIRQISGTILTTLGTPAAIAPLNRPRGVTTIGGTNLVVADTDNHRLVVMSGAFGAVLAGTGVAGSADGIGVLASFNEPSGITQDGYGNLYVSDAGSHLIRRVTPFGEVQTIAGSVAGNVNNDIGTSARLDTPRALAADAYGAVFFAEGSANNSVRLVAPYQTSTPTNSFVVIAPFTGPATNTQPVGGSSLIVARGITNSVFGLELSGGSLTASRETFKGVAASVENGTNFFYAVGGAQFSTNAAGGLSDLNRIFATKFDTNGRAIWTRGYKATAVAHAVTNGLGAITSLVLDFGGEGYTGTPVACLHDPLNVNPAKRNIPITLPAPVGGVIPSVPAFSDAGPFVSPRVYIEAPITPDMPGNAIAVAYGTNVIVAGYTNTITGMFTNNSPFLMSLNPVDGSINWVRKSPSDGHYNGVAISGSNIIAVGATYIAGSVGNSNCLIESWRLDGTFVTNVTHTFTPATRPSALSGVVVVDALDRAYAVGTVSNNVASSDAVMLELDLVNLTVLSAVTNNLNAGFNYGRGIASDGTEIYVAMDGPSDVLASDRQAGLFRYRAKNFYLAEESLNVFIGESTWGTGPLSNQWRLQITDTRVGGTNGPAQVVSWNLNFSYAPSNAVAIPLAASLNNTFVLLAQPNYFNVSVPGAATSVTNYINATAPVQVTFNALGAPLPGAVGNQVLFSGTSGSFVISTNTLAGATLVPGRKYYLSVEPLGAATNVSVDIRVDFDRTVAEPVVTALANATPLDSFIPRTKALSHYRFEVPADASGALFELLNLTGNAQLYVRRSNGVDSLPTTTTYDYRSANLGTLSEQIFLVTNSASAAALAPGTWFVSVENADNGPVSFTIRATTTTGAPYQFVTVADGQVSSAMTSPGNAPNTLFHLPVSVAHKGLLFELNGLTGPGDLIVRRSVAPLATSYDAGGFRVGRRSEVVAVRTNAGLPSVVGDWYFGVLNPGNTHISYTVIARQPSNGVLLGSSPIQIVRPPAGLLPGGQGFGFDLEVVPGEKYQVQYSTNLGSANWLVLTNLVASPEGVVNFLHSGALSNRNLYYRIQVVP